MNRMPEVEVLPACGHYGLGVVSYSPIARGILAGKYLPGQAPPRGHRGPDATTSGCCRPNSLRGRRTGCHLQAS